MKSFISYTTTLFGIVLLILSSCTKTEQLPGNGGDDNEKDIKIEMFTRSIDYEYPRARGWADENTVGKTPWVLVFSGDNSAAKFVQAVQAYEVDGVNKRYIILTGQGGPCQLLLLANPQNEFFANNVPYAYTTENFRQVLDNKTLSEACNLLLSEPLSNPQTTVPFVNAQNNQVLPMSYLLGVDGINETTEIGTTEKPLKLVRTVSKIIVRSQAADFEFRGITAVVNAPQQGQLHNLSSVPQNVGSLVEYRKNAAYSTNIADAELLDGVMTTANDPLYLYETPISNNTYLIIKGKYGNNPESYYKMEFVGNKQEPLDILRNQEYIFTITSVGRNGYLNVDEAKAGVASNINYCITVRDEFSYEITANNQYFLAVSNSYFIGYTKDPGQEFSAFTVFTDCTDNTLDNRIWASSGNIQITSAQQIPTNGDPLQVKFRFLNGVTQGTIYVQIGDLNKTITVKEKGPVAPGMTIPFYNVNGSIDPMGEEFYSVSGYVEQESKSWIFLAGSSGLKNERDHIYVDDGKIQLIVDPALPSRQPDGTVYLSTIKEPANYPYDYDVFRVKLSVGLVDGSVIIEE